MKTGDQAPQLPLSQLPHLTWRAVCLAATLALLAPAAAQPVDHPARTWYAGTVTDAAGTASPAIVDLTLTGDGFAFARLQLPAEHALLLGGGFIRDETDMRIVLREPRRGTDPWWAAELAHSEYRGADVTRDEPLPPVAAVLSASRDVDFANEGLTLTGTLRRADGSPATLSATRLATAARSTFAQGRVQTSSTLPHVHGRSPANELIAGPAQDEVAAFAAEGLSLDEDGEIGWGWWLDERWEIVGAAGEYLSLLGTATNYTGGAHPNTFLSSTLVNGADGAASSVALPELFASGSDWLAVVSGLVLEDLAAQEAAWVVQGEVTSLSADDLAVFTLDATGLTFHFSPYAMGPYVQGSFRVTVPFEALSDLADPAGALAAFAAGEAPLSQR